MELRLRITNSWPAGQVIPQQLQDDLVHHARMKDASDQRHHQNDEREERQNRIGCDRKCKGVNLGAQKVFHGRNHEAGLVGPNVASRRVWQPFRRRSGRNGGRGHVNLNRIRGRSGSRETEVSGEVTGLFLNLS